jgi:hypothetical protein
MPLLGEKYPSFFSSQSSARRFLLTINVLFTRRFASCTRVRSCRSSTSIAAPRNILLVGYKSERKLCALAQGFVEGRRINTAKNWHSNTCAICTAVMTNGCRNTVPETCRLTERLNAHVPRQ